MATQSLVAKNKEDEYKSFGVYVGSKKISDMLLSSLGSEKAKQKFVANVLSAVSGNPELQKCDYSTVISAGLMANALDLSLSPSLGFAYLVPFNDTKNNRVVATFIPGYKGYIQLAIRSGFYADMDVYEVREGEYHGRDSMTRKPIVSFIEDDEEREKKAVVGYMAFFEYINGFKKFIYWSKEKMLKHADTYSKAFTLDAVKSPYPNKCKVSFADYEAGKVPQNEMWKYSSFWYKNFDDMAKKTMLKHLISKWGIMSTEMQKAVEIDNEATETENSSEAFSVENDFFGNTEGLDNPDTTEVEEATVPKKVRKKKNEVEKIPGEENFFGEGETFTD